MRSLPLISSFKGYQPAWLRADVLSGLAVAAVSLPSAIAYPAIAGLPPETGVFATIVAFLAYAAVGPSRQLMVGPDAATVMMLGAVLASLGVVATADRVTVAAALAILVGLLCFVSSALRLGFIANFLSRPILVGFLAGVSLSILVGQIGRLTSVSIESDGFFPPLLELASKSAGIHWPSLALGGGLLLLLRVLQYRLPAVPGPLVAVVLGMAMSAAFDFQAMGIGMVGQIPSQLPLPGLPIPHDVSISRLLLGAAAMLIVSFGSGIVTARSFGAKNREPVDANREFVGFGVANVASGLFGGFAVTAADSRTAINNLMGGKTQVVGIVAALALALSVSVFSDALAILPTPALGAVLASAALGLIDLPTLRALWRVSRVEFAFAIVSMVGVVGLGVLNGVAIAVGGTLLYLIMKGVWPRDALLGRIPGRDGFYKLHRYPEARPVPGLVIYLVQGSLLFFNVDHVRRRLEEIIGQAPPETEWLIFEAGATAYIDSTAAGMLDEVRELAQTRGLRFGIVDLHSEPREILSRAGVVANIGPDMTFDHLEDMLVAFNAWRRRRRSA